jgi:hypothetical protein
MDLKTILIGTAICLAMGIIYCLPSLRRWLLLQRTPTLWMNALPEHGLIQVTGKVIDNITQAPLSKTPCTFWQFYVLEKSPNGNKTYWRKALKKTSASSFSLGDGTGEVTINSKKACLVLNNETSINLDASQKAILKNDFSFDLKDFDGKMKKLQAYERLLVAGDEVYVLGSIRTVNGTKEISSGFFNRLIISQMEENALMKMLQRETMKKFGQGILLAILIVIWFLLYQ